MRFPPSNKTHRLSDHGRIGMLPLAGLVLLLVFPGYALSRLVTTVDWRVLAAAPMAVSIFTFFAYRSDKRRAEAGEWRIPESMLHLGELVGGWPGAFLAQRRYRHKTAKTSYQIAFWLIVLIHQSVAFDSLFGWRMAKELIRLIRSQVA